LQLVYRRNFILCATVSAVSVLTSGAGRAQGSAQTFEDQLSLASTDPVFATTSSQFKEEEFRQAGPSLVELRGNANLPRRWVSGKEISRRAVSLIVAFEVTNETVYARSYSRPMWPQGLSGVTVGIGYDLGYVSKDDIAADWATLLSDPTTKQLQSVQGITRGPARAAADQIRDVVIDWDTAMKNFKMILRFYAGETVQYYPNSDELPPDSFGALVSLIYNRGSATRSAADDPLDRRKEMREIQRLCLLRQFDLIPDQIRKMERLWQNDKAAAGLLKRRELEALLFQSGLKQ